jgi:hypothetical protein
MTLNIDVSKEKPQRNTSMIIFLPILGIKKEKEFLRSLSEFAQTF